MLNCEHFLLVQSSGLALTANPGGPGILFYPHSHMYTWHTQLCIHKNGKKIKELQSLRFYIIFPCNLHYGPAIPLLSNYLKEINMKDPLKDLDNNVYMKPQTENNQRLSIGWQTSNGGIAELLIATAAKLQNEKCLLSTCTRM